MLRKKGIKSWVTLVASGRLSVQQLTIIEIYAPNRFFHSLFFFSHPQKRGKLLVKRTFSVANFHSILDSSVVIDCILRQLSLKFVYLHFLFCRKIVFLIFRVVFFLLLFFCNWIFFSKVGCFFYRNGFLIF